MINGMVGIGSVCFYHAKKMEDTIKREKQY
jgi:hypothetical protein